VPFNGTLAEPKILAIVGGDADGGGLPDPDEPPPQAALENKLAITLRKSDAERIVFQNFKLLSAPLYFYFCSC
jgi:hypothetical protein